MPKIKLNFEGEEKILPEDPKSFPELYNLFQKLFLREQNDNNYIFCLDKEKTNSIDIGNFTEKIQEIKNMKEPKIYVGIKDYIELNNRSVNVTVLLNDDNKQNVEGYNENIEQNNNFDFNLVKESKSIELTKINNSGDLNNNYGEIVEIMEKEIKNTKNILDKEINRMEILNENLDILYCLDDLIRENNIRIKSLEKENKEYLKNNEELLKKINSYENEDKVQLIEKIIKLEKEIEKYKNNMINIFKDEDDNNKNNENKIKELENKIKEKDEIIKNMTKKNNEDLEKLVQLHNEKKLLENINKEKQIKIISLDKENKEKSNEINNLNKILAEKENQMNEEKKQLIEKFKKNAMVKLHQKIEEFGAKIDNIFGNSCNNIK